jgi:hypothetical protein
MKARERERENLKKKKTNKPRATRLHEGVKRTTKLVVFVRKHVHNVKRKKKEKEKRVRRTKICSSIG